MLVGEFQEVGFTLTFIINLQQKGFEKAMNDWFDYVESQSWRFGGGGSLLGNRAKGHLCQYNNRTMTESDRKEAGK
ncbi:50S ribosome-binding protein YggL [Aeromonas veronii]|uniref:50S ribosome-binding protein YggL n=1 Tax=Aeromonas veronii TaxID=654 RepID=UPI003857A1AB